tara:strand:+ start:4200 stop:4670 length:471 start_codon:yes stop_codon:yes gene_type:complete
MSKYFLEADELNSCITSLKKKDKKIGFTNGCFDLLHKGHIHLLKETKYFCDFLIVAINSDSSIKSLKGKDRPIDNESIRIKKLSKLNYIDFIIIFNEETPLKLIKKLSPNILFKGSDYENKEIVGENFVKEQGGEIKLIDLIKGISTTKIINNMKI